MSFGFNVERGETDADLSVTGSLTAPVALELFNHITHLLDGGYHVNLDLRGTDFVGLGAVRMLRTAMIRAEKAGIELRLQPSRSLYRVADLVGSERWSPLPRVEFEGDWVTV